MIVGLAPVPVTVNGYVPLATELAAVTVSVVDDPVAGSGENAAVALREAPGFEELVASLAPK